MSLIRAHGGWGPFKSFRDTWDFFGAKNQLIENQIGAWPMEEFYLRDARARFAGRATRRCALQGTQRQDHQLLDR